MTNQLRPRDLCAATGISVSYSSQILSGSRPCPPAIALAAFRTFGVRLGLLAEMTDADIASLAAQQSAPAQCHSGDAAASVGDQLDHVTTHTPSPASLSTGQAATKSCEEAL